MVNRVPKKRTKLLMSRATATKHRIVPSIWHRKTTTIRLHRKSTPHHDHTTRSRPKSTWSHHEAICGKRRTTNIHRTTIASATVRIYIIHWIAGQRHRHHRHKQHPAAFSPAQMNRRALHLLAAIKLLSTINRTTTTHRLACDSIHQWAATQTSRRTKMSLSTIPTKTMSKNHSKRANETRKIGKSWSLLTDRIESIELSSTHCLVLFWFRRVFLPFL